MTACCWSPYMDTVHESLMQVSLTTYLQQLHSGSAAIDVIWLWRRPRRCRLRGAGAFGTSKYDCLTLVAIQTAYMGPPADGYSAADCVLQCPEADFWPCTHPRRNRSHQTTAPSTHADQALSPRDARVDTE